MREHCFRFRFIDSIDSRRFAVQHATTNTTTITNTFVISKNLNDTRLIDLEPTQIGRIQSLYLIGIFFLALAVLASVCMLMYLLISTTSSSSSTTPTTIRQSLFTKNNAENDELSNRKTLNFSASSSFTLSFLDGRPRVTPDLEYHDKRASSSNSSSYSTDSSMNDDYGQKRHQIIDHGYFLILILILISEFLARLLALRLVANAADSYLNELFRTSYAVYTDLNYFHPKYDTFFENLILKHFYVNKGWPFWLGVCAMLSSFVAIVVLVVFLAYEKIIVKSSSSFSFVNSLEHHEKRNDSIHIRPVFILNDGQLKYGNEYMSYVNPETISDYYNLNMVKVIGGCGGGGGGANKAAMLNAAGDTRSLDYDRLNEFTNNVNRKFPTVIFRSRSLSERISRERRKISNLESLGRELVLVNDYNSLYNDDDVKIRNNAAATDGVQVATRKDRELALLPLFDFQTLIIREKIHRKNVK